MLVNPELCCAMSVSTTKIPIPITRSETETSERTKTKKLTVSPIALLPPLDDVLPQHSSDLPRMFHRGRDGRVGGWQCRLLAEARADLVPRAGEEPLVAPEGEACCAEEATVGLKRRHCRLGASVLVLLRTLGGKDSAEEVRAYGFQRMEGNASSVWYEDLGVSCFAKFLSGWQAELLEAFRVVPAGMVLVLETLLGS